MRHTAFSGIHGPSLGKGGRTKAPARQATHHLVRHKQEDTTSILRARLNFQGAFTSASAVLTRAAQQSSQNQ
eukprot:CAMPEP_0178442894 /NCGR_PEP_ID=MMETSP0689_2-20121128/38489_1 /TAXON_ID=160604 /ORGANISM="Amphidinium massartii, Strain CS-259" /LENGTH=71 /DNA_ID=CAMNT_0020066633 /DNA_START=33 /DNA_END=248 /DNA_ORIENTATION=+